MKNVVRIGVLMDLYDNLLTERQRNVLNFYYNEDYSLLEISELTGVTRQAAHDTIKKSVRQLEKFDSAIGLTKQYDRIKQKLKYIKEKLNQEGVKSVDQELDDLISIL